MGVSPVIVIGCGRSGTSMLTRLLEETGLFVGDDLEANHESRFFQQINAWVMRECGGAFDQPEPVREVLTDPKRRDALASFIGKLIESRHLATYLGWHTWVVNRGASRISFPWGWKDPRNTVTLPMWLKIFPEAKVIHICRHGVDVANSLYVHQTSRRNEEALEQKTKRLKDRFLSWDWRHPLRSLRHPLRQQHRLPGSRRVSSMAGAFEYWTVMTEEARRHAEKLGSRATTVRYEELVADPVPHLDRLARFAGLEMSESGLRASAERVDASRARAYRDDEDLMKFAEENRERLARFEYDV